MMERQKFEEFKRRMAAKGIAVREEKPPASVNAEITASPRKQFAEARRYPPNTLRSSFKTSSVLRLPAWIENW